MESEHKNSAASGDQELRKAVKSSIVIIPPEEIWAQIQTIREKHDKSFVRWMPHINMVYPFVEDDSEGNNFKEASEKLKKGLSHIKPFKVTFPKSSFGYFSHKKDSTLWLKPLEENPVEEILSDVDAATNADELTANAACGNSSDVMPSAATHDDASKKLSNSEKKKLKRQAKKEMEQKKRNTAFGSKFRFHPDVIGLQSALVQVYPYCNDVSKISDGFRPHLSVGQFKHNDIDDFMQGFMANWTDIEFTVSEVCLISRADFDDPFHVRYRVPLGESVDKS